MIKAILILPFNVLVVVPFLVLYFIRFERVGFDTWNFAMSCVLAILALCIMIWTMILFKTKGEGTPAPWNPPQKLVVEGPYKYVRNPMLLGVFVFLLSEVIFFDSFALLVYWLAFVMANAFYFPFSEEKALEKRFGDDYLEYKRNVPRYIPRLTPWNK